MIAAPPEVRPLGAVFKRRREPNGTALVVSAVVIRQRPILVQLKRGVQVLRRSLSLPRDPAISPSARRPRTGSTLPRSAVARRDVAVAVRHRQNRLQRILPQATQTRPARRARRRMPQRLKLRQRHVAGRRVDRDRERNRVRGAIPALDHSAAGVEQRDRLVVRREQPRRAGADNRQRERRRRTFVVLARRRRAA